jgi:glycogen(starch) synthase
VISPLGDRPVPEAVEEAYFRSGLAVGGGQEGEEGEGRVIGSFARPNVHPMVEQTLARIQRFRSDVTWKVFDRVPAPADLAGVDVWVDPAVGEADYDGFVAEALVVGLPVVASRTAINALRLEKGRTGWLVPPGDPNEMTHAILAALFKPEVARSKTEAARQTVSKFRARQRVRELVRIYETLIS